MNIITLLNLYPCASGGTSRLRLKVMKARCPCNVQWMFFLLRLLVAQVEVFVARDLSQGLTSHGGFGLCGKL